MYQDFGAELGRELIHLKDRTDLALRMVKSTDTRGTSIDSREAPISQNLEDFDFLAKG